MFASLFTTVIVQPIFNLLTVIYALLPGHNYGSAIIIFTIAVRFAMYPLLKKQLYHTKAMRALQPEIKKIKKDAAGDKAKESQLTMELYKERQINPFSSLGIVIVQIPLFLALFSVLKRVVNDPNTIISFSYPAVQQMSWMQTLAKDISLFDNTLFGFINLNRAAISNGGAIYWPAMALVAGSSAIQYLQIRQTMPNDKDARKVRDILKEAGEGKQADQSEINAALSRNMSYVFPILIFFLTVSFAAALSLYWLVGGIVAYLQQDYLLKKDKDILMAGMGKAEKKHAGAVEAEVVEDKTVKPKPIKTPTKKTPAKKAPVKRKKRR